MCEKIELKCNQGCPAFVCNKRSIDHDMCKLFVMDVVASGRFDCLLVTRGILGLCRTKGDLLDAVCRFYGVKLACMEKIGKTEQPFTLRQLQEEQRPWAKRNFGDRPAWQPLLGALEELGELAHAHLKEAQKIRTGEAHVAMAQDAVADIVIYLADYCSARGWDFEKLVEEVWAKVKKRDWKADSKHGGERKGENDD